MITIKNRYTGEVLLKCKTLHGVDLHGIDLHEADLYAADLREADLCGADLHEADLYAADLREADLCGADLHGAYLCVADLHEADLSGADLHGAYLRGADLSRAYLSGANLRGVNIDDEIIAITPLQIYNLAWDVLITDGFMRIGCQQHSHNDWAEFSDAEIGDMDGRALEFWKAWKEPLLAMCKAHAERAENAQD